MDNLPTKYTALGKSTIYTYNSLNQLADRNVDTTTDINTHYVYNTVTLDGNLYYTNQLNCEILNGTSYHYTYDDVGNIIAIKKGTGYGSTTSDYKAYSYDNKYQLTRETMGSTVNSWSYDALGNILSKTTSVNGATTNTVTYGYGADSDCGWENLLTNITIKNYTDNTEITETIDYDAIGNPVVYRGANLSWYGRQLTDYSKGGVNANFTYDAEGLRSTKTVNGVKTTYQYVGDQLLYEDRGNGTKLYYFYDSNGILSAIYHHENGVKTAYHVQTNYQGDVVALYDWSGSLVAKYDYDAWGNILSVTDANGAPITSSTHIANVNPFRYRSYYYDNDLGLYYLQSRYYDSGIGRFVNGDNIVAGVGGAIQGYNLSVYCFNNPVNRDDQDGNWSQRLKNAVKWVAKNVVKPAVKGLQNSLSKVDLTCSTGYNISFSPSIVSFNGQIGFSADTKGNFAIQASGCGGFTSGTPGVSVTRYTSVTNAPDIDRTNGEGYQVGGSLGVPIEMVPMAIGGDIMIMPDSEANDVYYGATGNVGLGTPGGEIHVEIGTTGTVPGTRFNAYDIAQSIYIEIMEW